MKEYKAGDKRSLRRPARSHVAYVPVGTLDSRGPSIVVGPQEDGTMLRSAGNDAFNETRHGI